MSNTTTKQKQVKLVVIIFILLAIGLTFLVLKNNLEDGDSASNINTTSQTETGIKLLDGFPNDQIPLYKLINIESVKFFVNDDPQNYKSYFGTRYNYYNVVFETDADKSEFIEYYQSKMDIINEDNYNQSSIEGKINKYGVSASYYNNSSKTAYLQVYLPENEFSKTNKFFSDYPKQLVELDPEWVEHESSYGKLNQLGGQIEYTQYFSINLELFDQYLQDYTKKYSNKNNFKNTESGYLSWKDGEYSINLSFAKDHGRVYLMIRKSI